MTNSLPNEFEIEVDVFLSKKKKNRFSLVNPLISYLFFKEIIRFITIYWKHRQEYFPGYNLLYPILNQSIKWRFDYIMTAKKKSRQQKKIKNGGSIR